jgi:hypothetical protein
VAAGTHQIRVTLTKLGSSMRKHREKTTVHVSLSSGKQSATKATSLHCGGHGEAAEQREQRERNGAALHEPRLTLPAIAGFGLHQPGTLRRLPDPAPDG